MKQRGQVLIGVIVLMLLVAIIVPAMVLYTQNQARWSQKETRNTTAFQLAEGGVERGYRAISQSTGVWNNGQNGIFPAGYLYDTKYNDLSGGYYTIAISSGPGKQQVTILGIGKDAGSNEIRAIKAVYANVLMGDIAIVGGSGVNVSGNNLTVEWGAILSQASITPNTALHPSMWAAGNIVGLDTNGSAPPNCDQPNCWWWHSYYPVPPEPVIDFNFYKTSATNSGNGPCGSYYTNGNKTGTCSDTSGKPYYVTGNWTSFNGPITGSVIVLGSLSTPNGVMNGQNITASVPSSAWKQYCNDWTAYQGVYDNSPYTSACPGLNSSYAPTGLTYAISPVVWGMLYIGGDFTGPQGGGNTDMVYGILIVKGNVYLNSNSHVKIWYDSNASNNMFVSQINLTRKSWQDVNLNWPGGL